MHKLINIEYPNSDKEYLRNMTLVLAERCDEVSIREALRNKRIKVTNKSSLPSVISWEEKEKKKEKEEEKVLLGLGSIIFTVSRKSEKVDIKAANMSYGEGKSPVISFELKNSLKK